MRGNLTRPLANHSTVRALTSTLPPIGVDRKCWAVGALVRRNLLRIRNATLLAGVSFLAPFGAEAQTCTVTTGQPVQVTNGTSCTIPTGSIIDVNQLNTDSVLAEGSGSTITSLAPGSSVTANGGTVPRQLWRNSLASLYLMEALQPQLATVLLRSWPSGWLQAARTCRRAAGVLMSNGTTVMTTGATAPGVAAVEGGTVTLTGNSITTSGHAGSPTACGLSHQFLAQYPSSRRPMSQSIRWVRPPTELMPIQIGCPGRR